MLLKLSENREFIKEEDKKIPTNKRIISFFTCNNCGKRYEICKCNKK